MKLIQDLGMIYLNPNSNQKRRYGIYECPICEKHIKRKTYNVKHGISTQCKSCGAEKHGLSKTRLYGVWHAEIQRCENVNNNAYKHYGARGIYVSDEFKDFEVWNKYVTSLPNANKKDYSIDRINNNKGYEIGNLRWATNNTQRRNTRKIQSNNTTGYRGVFNASKKGRYVSKITIDSKSIHLGTFDYKYTAGYAYDSYVIKNNLEHTRNFNTMENK